MIHTLRLDGFLSFAPVTDAIGLEPLNVVIGPNGSGKSNFVSAFELLAAAASDLAGTVRRGGGVEEWIWKGEPEASEMEIEVVIDARSVGNGHDLRYRLNLGSNGRRLELVDEAVEETCPGDKVISHYRFRRGRPEITIYDGERRSEQRRIKVSGLLPDQSILSQRKDPDQYPGITRLGEALGSIQVVGASIPGRGSPIRASQLTDLPDDRLLPDGSNLALMLDSIIHRDDAELNELLAGFLPSFRRLSTRTSGGRIELYVHERGLRAPVSASRLSDGTLRFLALLAILLAPSPPPVVCIEEPELAMHPDAMALLARLLMEASERTQVIVTTHSEALVSVLTEAPESVLVCEGSTSGTVLKRLDRERLNSWLEDYTLDQLWAMGELGGNP